MRGLFDETDSSDDDRDAAETARSSKPTSSDGYEFLDNPHTSEDVLAHEAGSGQGTPFIFPTHPKRPRSSSKDAHRKRPGSFARLEIGSEENAVSKTFILLRPFKAMSAMRNNLKEDFGSILLLLFLYLLQGIPLGLISAVPILLQSKHVTYTQQALFSFAFWPFSLKLLWAPIVDSLYFQRIGRRKSWMVPCQYLIGAGLLYISYFSPYAVGDSATKVEGAEEKAPNVLMLMLVFLPLNFLAATQDIAVDGWALTMLSRKNVGYASTCNVVGQTIGYFWGNVGLLTLESKDFCNRFRSVPQEYGFVDLSSKFF
uniref:Acetyl-coenzyme A transporter 1 n=1 Tax=Panagrellus redivivus TaxID=6233 RepID=A0A7E4WBZ2_PANRE